MAIPVPTLSAQGWITSVPMKCDYLLAHFFEADGNLNYLYPNTYVSLQSLLAMKSGDHLGLMSTLQATLERYFARYFSACTVQVTDDQTGTASDSNKVKLYVHIAVIEDGKEYSVGKSIESVGSKFAIVADKINYGDTANG